MSKRNIIIEKICNLSACAPSLREDFWNHYLPEERDKIFYHMSQQAEIIVDRILKGEEKFDEFAEMMYSHASLRSSPSGKLQSAKVQMQEFFSNYVKIIKSELGESNG